MMKTPLLTKTLTGAAQLNVHAKSWPLCDIKDELCPDPQYLQQHHKPQEPTNQCRVCGKIFGSSRALASHTRRDHNF